MSNHIKKNVMITGASSGIGYELANVFASKGYNLILIARRKEILNNMAEKFYKKYKTETIVIQKDLNIPKAACEIFNHIIKQEISIDILVNNAGVGEFGLFHEGNLEKQQKIIQINIVFLIELTKLIVKRMVKKHEGKILNVASTGAYQPGALTSVYYASKAYVLSFSEAIHNELKPYNVFVSVLCPGTTKSEFSKKAGRKELKNAMDAKTVANIAYDGMMKNKMLIIPGWINKFSVIMSKVLPGKLLAIIVRKIQEKTICKNLKEKN